MHGARFKLHLRPDHLDSEEVNKRDLPPLPQGKTVMQVFADFLRYLYTCTKTFIIDTHASGESIWNSLKDQIDFVLAHPNGWEGLQQSKMREAAILAALVPDTLAGRARIHFVTEGEASLHYCVQSGLTSETIEVRVRGRPWELLPDATYSQAGHSVMVIDAGGGTVDISSYSFTSTTPLAVEEIASADCERSDDCYSVQR